MGTLSYYIRPSSKNKTIATINLSYSWEKKSPPFRKSLKLSIPVKSWDEKKQRLKNISEVFKYRDSFNEKLDVQEKFFEDLEKDIIANDLSLSKELINKKYNDFLIGKTEIAENLNTLFLDELQKYIDELPYIVNRITKKPVSNRTIQSFKTTKSYLLKFEKHKNKKLKFEDVGLDFHSDFMSFLKSEHNLAPNTIGGYVKHIKTFCNQSARKFNVNPESLTSDFFVLKEETESIILNEEEIDLVFNHDFSDNKRYENVRDWQIIGLWTGLRVSDWLKVENIKDGFVTIKMQKGKGGEVVIPIHWQIEEIIKKRGFPKPVSDVEFNRVVKWLCKDVGLTKKVFGSRRNPETNRKETGSFSKHLLIGSHTCRRSFATNLYNSDFPTLSIMKITGHTTESSFLKYIKVTPKEHAQKLKRHWDLKYSKK
ncbi:tyrosine-type recombinase/integrase [Bacteroidota bacterium]